MMDEVLDFLGLVWGDQKGWVDIPTKVNGLWIPWAAQWPEDTSLIGRRIESSLEDEEDIYFSVCQFKAEGRRIADTMPSGWLWADLDRVDPLDCQALGLTPTVCWESSPFRYQALWALDRVLKPETLAKLNKALTYAIGADRGGWDLTQVLRPPGTRNFKYHGNPEVLLVYDDGPEYKVGEIWNLVKDFAPKPTIARPPAEERVLRKIPAAARRLLATPADRVVEGERSNQLYKLNCLLMESGLRDDQIYQLVEPTPWNKFDTSEQLIRDIERIRKQWKMKQPTKGLNGGTTKEQAAHAVVDEVLRADEVEDFDLSTASDEAVEDRYEMDDFTTYSRFMAENLEAPRWLINDLWMAGSHGIIGGEAKSSKSLMAMAMGLSVASGKPFMGDDHFHVSKPGPVLIIQEENSRWDVQDKIRKLARLYGLIGREDIRSREVAASDSIVGQEIVLDFPADCPLLIRNCKGFDMSDEEQREALERKIQFEGAAMVIFDPLYLMLGDADSDKARDVRPFQRWLLHLRHNLNTAVVLVHHFGKPRAENAGVRRGHRLLGSGTWYNWVDSAMYCEPCKRGAALKVATRSVRPNRSLRVEREWRSAAPAEPLELQMFMGKPGSLVLKVDVGAAQDSVSTIIAEIEEAVTDAGKTGALATAIAESIGRDPRTVKKYAVGSGKFDVERKKRGKGFSYRLWTVGTKPE